MNSLEQEKEKLLIALKSHTISSVFDNEIPKIPIVISNKEDVCYKDINSNITVVKQFHYDDRWFNYKYSIDEPQYTFGIIKVDNMPYNSFQNKKNKKSFVCTMHDLLYQRYCEPFMIFINGKFVNWNYINIVFDCDDTYILLYGEEYNWYNLKSANIDIVILPFKVDYIGEESDQYFDMMYDIYKSYLQDSVSSNDNNRSTIVVPGIDEVYEYNGMVYNIGAWIYTQLKYAHLDMLSARKLSKLKNVDVYQYSYDDSGNKISSYYMKFNTFDKDSYNKTLYSKICYSNKSTYENKAMIRFNSNGLCSDDGVNILSLIDSDIKVFKISNPNEQYFSQLSLENQIFRQNLLLFKNGLYISNKNIDIYYNNIYNDEDDYDKYSFYIIYYSPIEQVLNHLNNHFSTNFSNSYVLNYLKSNDDNINDDNYYRKKYVNDSINPLYFSYDDTKLYEDNKSDAFNTVMRYDVTLLNSLYKTNIESKVFTGEEANTLIRNNITKYGKRGLVISRSKYENHESYVMVFENGELLEEYSDMIVSSNYFFIPINRSFNNTTEIELLYFNKINNNEINFTLNSDIVDPIDTTNSASNDFNYIPLTDDIFLIQDNQNSQYEDRQFTGIFSNNSSDFYYQSINTDIFKTIINKDELKIFSDFPEMIIKYKTLIINNRLDKDNIAFNITKRDEDNTLYMSPLIEYGSTLTAVSSRKFIYQRLYVDQKAYRIKIDKRFKYCDNQKQYMLFINGRRMNDESFLITIPKHTRPFWDMYLYTAKFVSPEDRIELFYVPEEIIDININHESELDNNGYIMTNKSSLNAPYDPRLYLLFINGKKISNNNIIAVDSSTFRVLKDYQSTNNLMINPIYSNNISDITNYMNSDILSEYDELIKYIKLNLDESELDKIFNIFIDMSNTDVDKTKQNVEKIAILNEIIRDFWISSGYAYNEGTFVYDYELLLNDISLIDDTNPFYSLPALDATQAKNIIKNELYIKSFNIYTNNGSLSNGYFERGTSVSNIYFQWEYIEPQNSFADSFEIIKQSIEYNNTIVNLNTYDRTWVCYHYLNDDISFKFHGNTVFKDVYKNINVKFVNGIFYGNIDEDIIKNIKNDYLLANDIMALLPISEELPSVQSQEQESSNYTLEHYSNDNIIVENLEFHTEDTVDDIVIPSTDYIVNEITAQDILDISTMNKVLQESPEIVLNNYTFGNNNYFIYACPTRLAYEGSKLLLEFIMPDPKSKDVQLNCRDDKATPIYTSGSWDDITNHNLFEPLEKMEMIYLGEFIYTNSSGYTELYSIWRSNGYFTRLFDKYKFDKIIVRYKDNTKTIQYDNN